MQPRSLDVELMERASQACGLSDFGPRQDFRVGLRVLLGAADEADCRGAARAALEASCVARLETRLKLVDLRREHPAIDEEPISGPVVVIGLPRTGTTALVDLLAQDPAARAPLQWETGNLFPPATRATWASDPRADALQAAFDAAARSNPIVALGLHTYGARLADECNSFLAIDFWSPNLTAARPLPAYNEWLRFGRIERPYATHRWILQHLQAHGPVGRWTLKSPFHAFALPELVAEYPDAMLVQTHRDPVELIASLAGLHATIRGEPPGDPARLRTGEEILALWSTGLKRCLAARRDPELDARVLDVSHRKLATDPLGTLAAVYDHFGLAFGAAAERGAAEWLRHPAQHRSTVRFALADFGLDADRVEATFAGYRARFGDLF